MSDDGIPPALTPEEWEAKHVWLTGAESAYVDTRGGLVVDSDDYYVRWTAWGIDGRRHAIAALCLYGQPFGFTPEDVDTLYDLHGMALNAIQERGDLEDATVPPRALVVIDKIRALLPPEP